MTAVMPGHDRYRGKTVLVVGLARSGLAACQLLLEVGAKVRGTDQKNRGELSPRLSELEKKGVVAETGGHTTGFLEGSDLVVTSPGVLETNPILTEARAKSIPVIGEIELAYSLIQGSLIAVTGTNGKTTTVSLIGEILKRDGRKVLIGGNIAPGLPFSMLALDSTPEHWLVVEVSTFQLETVVTFRPLIAVLTNITPDHLDRYPDFATYAELKLKLFSNQQPSDYAILNADDPTVAAAAPRLQAGLRWFSRRGQVQEGTWIDPQGVLTINNQGARLPICPVAKVRLPGPGNLENALAACAAAFLAGARVTSMADALREFAGVPHRLEEVSTYRGITYVNNSMCTNPAAGAKSLEAFDRAIILIAGGKDKGMDLTPLVEAIRRRAKAAVLLGENARHLEQLLRAAGYDKTAQAQSLKHAVDLASELASEGDVVLFSPGAASFDLFRDFEDRGDRFKRAVWEEMGRRRE